MASLPREAFMVVDRVDSCEHKLVPTCDGNRKRVIEWQFC